MKRFHLYRRPKARLLIAIVVALGTTLARATAADEPAAPAPAPGAPAAAPTGTWYVFSPPKEDEVLDPQSRIKLLNLTKVFLERNKPDLLAHLNSAENPFFAKPPPPPPTPEVASTTTSNAASSEPAAPTKLSDEDRLKAIAEKLQPTGMIEGAQTRLVTLSSGGTIEVGQSFTANVPPDLTVLNITLVDANENECVLKLNSTTLPVSYVSKPIGASRSPSSNSPPQPKSRD